MLKPTLPAILCAIGVVVVTVQAEERGDIQDAWMSQWTKPMQVDGINNNQLAADTRILARVPQSHEAYGWRYPDAFPFNPPLMKTGEPQAPDRERH
jgi:hypothetical protein